MTFLRAFFSRPAPLVVPQQPAPDLAANVAAFESLPSWMVR